MMSLHVVAHHLSGKRISKLYSFKPMFGDPNLPVLLPTQRLTEGEHIIESLVGRMLGKKGL